MSLKFTKIDNVIPSKAALEPDKRMKIKNRNKMEKLFNDRFHICMHCPERHVIGVCKVCGCILKAKTLSH